MTIAQEPSIFTSYCKGCPVYETWNGLPDVLPRFRLRKIGLMISEYNCGKNCVRRQSEAKALDSQLVTEGAQ